MGDTYAEADGDAHAYAYAYTETHADTEAHGNTYADTDAVCGLPYDGSSNNICIQYDDSGRKI